MIIYNKNSRPHKGKSLLKKVNNYTAVDIETTSLDTYYGEILEISAIKIRDNKEEAKFSKLIKVNNEIGRFTTNLTAITNEMVVKKGEDLIDVLQSFKNFVGNDIIIGHNVNFDINFIYDSMKKNLGEYLTNDYIDTLRLSRQVLPYLRHHKLDDLIKYFNLKSRNEHRALNDCVLTNQVYIKLCEILTNKYLSTKL